MCPPQLTLWLVQKKRNMKKRVCIADTHQGQYLSLERKLKAKERTVFAPQY
jgi:uncharacterized protein involved in exopolysaccharide biosynthesis